MLFMGFFFRWGEGISCAWESGGLGDVYKRRGLECSGDEGGFGGRRVGVCGMERSGMKMLGEQKSEILKAMAIDVERIREKIYRLSLRHI